jgi:hypothetical protein
MDQVLLQQRKIEKLMDELEFYKRKSKEYVAKYRTLDTEYTILQNKFNEMVKRYESTGTFVPKKIIHVYTEEEDKYLLENLRTGKTTIREQSKYLGLSYFSVYEHIQLLKGRQMRIFVANVIEKDKSITKVYENTSYTIGKISRLQLCEKGNSECSKCMFNNYCNKDYKIVSDGLIIAQNNKEIVVTTV